MTFVGIDMAAEPRRTGLAVLSGGDGCVVEQVRLGAGDDLLVEAVHGAQKAGVDVPLGWPQPFVELIKAHAAGVLPVPESTDIHWRRSLAMRATDLHVRDRTGLVPLSVSTDRIAYPALRWAGIEARLREDGLEVARDGSGVVCEVYPAAALRGWSLTHRGYKGDRNAAARTELVDAVSARHPWLDWNGFRPLCVEDDNALDAVLAALLARETAHGRCEPPPAQLRDLARREGWIWLPRPEAGPAWTTERRS